MTDKPMTPGQLAHAAYERALVQTSGVGSPVLWAQIHPDMRKVFDQVAAAVQQQRLGAQPSPLVESVELEPLDPEDLEASYIVKALRHLKATSGGDEACKNAEKTAPWLAIGELLSRVHDMEQEMHERFQP